MIASPRRLSLAQQLKRGKKESSLTPRVKRRGAKPSLAARMLGLLLAPLLLGVPAAAAGAHPISVTTSMVYVTQDKVTVHIEVFVEDLFLFHDLKPNDQDFLEPPVIEKGMEKHQQFLLQRFAIRDSRGDRLAGRNVQILRSEMPAEGVALADLMAYRLTFVHEYLLETPPEFLTFSQHFADDRLLVPAEMQLNVRQENGSEPYQQVLYPDSPQTVRFRWDAPPLSPDASEEQRRAWYERDKDQVLGITSYSSVYSFFYIQDHEVRHEILIPLMTLDESVLIARADESFLEIAEQDLAAEQIRAFFLAGNPVEIDGVVVEPVIDRLDFYGLEFKDFAVRAERTRVSMASARVGIILTYSTKGAPNTVRVTWDRFNRFLWSVNMIVFAYEDAQTVALTRIGRQNTFQWQNPGRPPAPPLEQVDLVLPPRPTWPLPLVSLGLILLTPAVVLRWPRSRFRGPVVLLLIGAAVTTWPLARWQLPCPLAAEPRLDDDQAAATLAALHRNIYRAFDYRDEEQVYDALAKSVDGPLLRRLYLEIRRGLVMQEQGGAVSRIREVRILQQTRLPSSRIPANSDQRAFVYDCRWTVAGTVEHWGHIHARTNQYQANLTVEPRNDAWKITALELQDERRLSFETRLRSM
jgi:hypothetical protein